MSIDCEAGTINILYESFDIIAIDKPEGLAIHRSKLVRNATEFLVDILKKELGSAIYPIHRLDRKTSGVMLVALTKESLLNYSRMFAERKVIKKYQSIIRGHLNEDLVIDYDLPNQAGHKSQAITNVKVLRQSEINLPDDRFPTSRYTLIEAQPLTGRTHQIRKHLAHVFHPIIGDRPHGCNKQNKLILENFGLTRMYLHATNITIPEFDLVVDSPLSKTFVEGLFHLGFNKG